MLPFPSVLTGKRLHQGQPALTALHRGLSKYLTAQDTRFNSTQFKHNKTMSSLGTLLSLRTWSTMQVNTAFLSLLRSKFSQKTRESFRQGNEFFPFYPFLRPNAITDSLLILESFIHGYRLCTGAFSANSAIMFYLKSPLEVLNVTFRGLL